MPATHDNAGIAANMDVKTVGDYRFDSFDACDRYAKNHEGEINGSRYAEWHIASNVRLRLERVPGTTVTAYFAIVLYNTEIVRYYSDRHTFSVDNGGYNTRTTAQRIMQFTPDGYGAGHVKKKLLLNGQPTGHDKLFPITRVSY